MKCKYCESEMEFVSCDDNGGGGFRISVAYNVYQCPNSNCMSLCREDVWQYAGERWIAPQFEEVRNFYICDKRTKEKLVNEVSGEVYSFSSKKHAYAFLCSYGHVMEEFYTIVDDGTNK